MADDPQQEQARSQTLYQKLVVATQLIDEIRRQPGAEHLDWGRLDAHLAESSQAPRAEADEPPAEHDSAEDVQSPPADQGAGS